MSAPRVRPEPLARFAAAAGVGAALFLSRDARAQEAPTAAPAPSGVAPSPSDASPKTILPEAPPEAPPPPPRRKGLVLEMGLGGLQFLGQFKHVAPLAPWAYLQVGYEPFKWLMVFGYGELSLTDTSEAEDESHQHAFAMFGFGGGLRFTVHATPRVALFAQGEGGAIEADVPRGVLANLGFKNAETFGGALGGRLGVEWYQIDRHLALGLGVGVRDLVSFQKDFGADTPLALDATAAIRYTF